MEVFERMEGRVYRIRSVSTFRVEDSSLSCIIVSAVRYGQIDLIVVLRCLYTI